MLLDMTAERKVKEKRTAAEQPEAEVQAAGPEAEPAAELDARAEQLAQELEDLKSRHLRLAADFENYKKRIRQEQEDAFRYSGAPLAERVLPVLDDAQLALEHAPDGTDDAWLKGVRLTFQKLEEALRAAGVQPLDAVGNRFDPKLHEAIGTVPSDEHPDDTVVSELRRGYRLHDRILRPALVRVSRKS